MRFPNHSPFLSDDFRALDTFFDEPFAPFHQLLSGVTQSSGQIAADVIESDGQLVVRLELPGVKREDIDVQYNNQKLTVRVEQSTEDDESKFTMSRSFAVKQPVASDKISASLSDGILTITMPKAEEAKARSIKID